MNRFRFIFRFHTYSMKIRSPHFSYYRTVTLRNFCNLDQVGHPDGVHSLPQSLSHMLSVSMRSGRRPRRKDTTFVTPRPFPITRLLQMTLRNYHSHLFALRNTMHAEHDKNFLLEFFSSSFSILTGNLHIFLNLREQLDDKTHLYFVLFY